MKFSVYSWEDDFSEKHILVVAVSLEEARKEAVMEIKRLSGHAQKSVERWCSVLERQPTISPLPYVEIWNLAE